MPKLHHLATALLPALLASCSPDRPKAEPEERPLPAAAPAAAPAAKAPAPAATPPAPAGAQPLTPQGWGALRIGMSRSEVTAALGPDSNPQAVGGPDPESCDEYRPARAPEGMLVMIENGRLTRISLIRDSKIRTDRGLALGATADEVRAAYGPRGTVTEPHKYAPPPGEYITFWPTGKPATDARDPSARGLRYVIETNRKVAMIHAGGPSIEYVEGCL